MATSVTGITSTVKEDLVNVDKDQQHVEGSDQGDQPMDGNEHKAGSTVSTKLQT